MLKVKCSFLRTGSHPQGHTSLSLTGTFLNSRCQMVHSGASLVLYNWCNPRLILFQPLVVGRRGWGASTFRLLLIPWRYCSQGQRYHEWPWSKPNDDAPALIKGQVLLQSKVNNGFNMQDWLFHGHSGPSCIVMHFSVCLSYFLSICPPWDPGRTTYGTTGQST